MCAAVETAFLVSTYLDLRGIAKRDDEINAEIKAVDECTTMNDVEKLVETKKLLAEQRANIQKELPKEIAFGIVSTFGSWACARLLSVGP